MKATEFDKRFDQGEDMAGHLDPASVVRPNRESKRVNVDFPIWMVELLDRESSRLGVSRQALIKIWLNDRLETERDGQARNTGA